MVHLQIIQGDAATDAELAEAAATRPTKRSECEGGVRPCPRVACRHHMLVDGATKRGLAFNGLPKDASDDDVIDRLFSMEETCSLDVVEKNPSGFDDRKAIGRLLGVSRERVRQLERVEPKKGLEAGFSSWFGGIREVIRRTPKAPEKAPGPPRVVYPQDVKVDAVKMFDAGAPRDECIAYVEAKTGNRPPKQLFYGWASNLRNHGNPSGKPSGTRHFITESMLREVWDMRDTGASYTEIARAMEGRYGRLAHANTVSGWMKRRSTK